MKIKTTKKLPSLNTLKNLLKKEFSDQYTYKFFGLGDSKSLIIQKSALVGVQITEYKNELRIDHTNPSVLAAAVAIISAYLMGTAGPVYWWSQWLFGSPYKKFEHEVGAFLSQKLV